MTFESHGVMRIFRARPKPGDEDAFALLLATESVALVRDRPGCQGWFAAGPADGEYLFVTLWCDELAVRTFAGERWQESVLPAGYADLLESHSVQHVSVFSSSVFDFGGGLSD